MKRYVHTVDAVFALLLFCAFAISMMMVLVMGAGQYKNIRDEIERHYSEDTAINYLAMKARHSDISDVYITRWMYAAGTEHAGEPLDVLCLSEGGDNSATITAIYFRDGYLREIYADTVDLFYVRPGQPIPDPDIDMINKGGEQIVPISSLVLSRIEGTDFVEITCTGTGGGTASFVVPASHSDTDIVTIAAIASEKEAVG